MSDNVPKTEEAAGPAGASLKTERAAASKRLEKERLAAALRENLKRRKAQTTARRNETAPD